MPSLEKPVRGFLCTARPNLISQRLGYPAALLYYYNDGCGNSRVDRDAAVEMDTYPFPVNLSYTINRHFRF